MNCTSCGAPLQSGAQFCVQCGAKVDISGSAVTKKSVIGKSPDGMVVLIMGILSLFMCTPLGLVAWIMGRNAQKLYPDDQNIKIGKLLGIIASVFLFIGLGGTLLIFIISIIVYFVTGSSVTESIGGSFFD